MIKHLRRRFTAVLMSLLGTVMLIVLGSVYVSMYRSENMNTDRIINFAMNLEMHKDNTDPPPQSPPDGIEEPPKDFEGDIHFDSFFFPQRTRQTRDRTDDISTGWISVTVDSSGMITDIFRSQQLYGSEDEDNMDAAAHAAAENILSNGNQKGIISVDGISYRYEMRDKDSGKVIVLLDRTNEVSTMTRLLVILAGIFALSLVVLFLLSVLLSKWAVTPIEDAWNRQRVFFSNASHELKTPLAVISANLDVITSNPDETVAEQGKWFGYIRSEADKMSRLINEMLYIAREERTDSKTVMAELDLSEAAEGACLAMEAVAFEKGKTLITDIEPNVTVKGDKESLTRTINILIDNAVSHSSEHSEITVRLKKSRGKAKLTVENQGKPIPKEDLQRIFDRYYRTDASRSRDTGGFGLGLAIAKTVAEKHGGSITAESDESRTVFTLII
ncbi:Phosphate regulon sensor protein phoR [uncultured Ruminococcus sp.]|uniref:sensor histidine kinase n=1 Tax=Huintestinicola butyrica TaxID=2981728 RepID=UPI000820907E|nr:HAMP domain-containing sensor histidine kinase [Huintestinicola butyrica]MCU6728502.1 HAMP domain-containing histidine kinase [Huintestinicola butyrica]SCJ16079.1 Phosphate regulon sensor protein phoR [uncultured Ruminococcus sp.]